MGALTRWAIIFAVAATAAGVLSFGGGGALAAVAKVLFFVSAALAMTCVALAVALFNKITQCRGRRAPLAACDG